MLADRRTRRRRSATRSTSGRRARRTAWRAPRRRRRRSPAGSTGSPAPIGDARVDGRPSTRCRPRSPSSAALAEQDDDAEGDAGDERDQPRVVEEPPDGGQPSTSALHLGELVERDDAAVAVDEQHHRQADADLGGGDADDVQREHLTVDVAVISANATRLRLTALRISSTDISTITAFLRAITPYTPMQNSTAPSSRKFAANTAQSFRARTMAPMAAASRMNDSARNGTR